MEIIYKEAATPGGKRLKVPSEAELYTCKHEINILRKVALWLTSEEVKNTFYGNNYRQ